MKEVLKDVVHKPRYDEFYTPEYAIKPLLKYLPKGLRVWECTDWGVSNIAKVLRDNGYDVISTWRDSLDFIEDDPDFEYDIIVTNPPYSTKNEFIKRCYELGKPFALLLPLTSLEGEKRGNMFRKNGIELMVIDRRINYMDNNNTNWFNTSWFCWNVLDEKLIFEHIEK